MFGLWRPAISLACAWLLAVLRVDADFLKEFLAGRRITSMSTSDTTVSRRTVFYKGARVGTIVGSRTFYRGAVTPQSGFDVWVDGTRNPLGNAGRLPYAYFAEIVTALNAGVFDAQFAAVRS